MKKLLTIIIAIMLVGCASNGEGQYDYCVGYIAVGAAYKFDETPIYGANFEQSPISARIEAGNDCGTFCYGVSHHSNWFEGWPVNSADEYGKTEVFVDYVHKFNWDDLL